MKTFYSFTKPAMMMFMSMLFFCMGLNAQMLQLPDGGVNYKCKTGRRVGVTDIEINWNAPGVKGREGQIWGTPVVPYGFTVLGFGSYVASPWRAGANESTTISFSTDVKINGKPLKAGKYGFFIAVYPDSCTLIFNKNTSGWGSYFYKSELDVLRVGARQQKEGKETKERLDYVFSSQTDRSVEVALEWERWRIPFDLEVDLTHTTLSSIQAQLSGAMGFDPPGLEAGAAWCLQNDVNFEEALRWINVVVDPNMGRVNTFQALSTKAGLLAKLDKREEADNIMKTALENATVLEMHSYGRQLLAEKKVKEAMEVFEKNHKKYKGAWPTNAGMMRGYSAMGDVKKALAHARLAVVQAPNDESKRIVDQAIKTLESGRTL
jgi:tetratricopeptide (TPR) repeat protein